MYFTGRRVGMQIRAVLVSQLYEKSLRRVTSSDGVDDDGQASLGKLVTLMSVDSERIRQFVSYSHDCLVLQPTSLIVALIFLLKVMGLSGLAGVAVILALAPIGAFLGKIIGRMQEELMNSTDSRINIMNEVLQGIRIVKYFAW